MAATTNDKTRNRSAFMTRETPVEADDRHTSLPGLRWPGGRHVAVVLNVAYEVWSQGQVSGVGPMGNPLPAGIFDTNADSYGRYGAVDGIPETRAGTRHRGHLHFRCAGGTRISTCESDCRCRTRHGRSRLHSGYHTRKTLIRR